VMNSNALSLPQPVYPAAAKTANMTGTVLVRVVIDSNGNVVSATAISGPPLFLQPAVDAAMNAKFSPVMISGSPTQTSGLIKYNFGLTSNVPTTTTTIENFDPSVSNDSQKETLLTPETKRQKLIDEKFHIWVADLIKRIDKKNPVSENEAKFVTDGKADVQILLTEKTPATLDQLKQLGLEIVSERDARTVVGRVAIEKLVAIAELEKVKYVLPEIKKSSLLVNRTAETSLKEKTDVSFFRYLIDLLRGAIFSPTMNSDAQANNSQTRKTLCDAQRQSCRSSV